MAEMRVTFQFDERSLVKGNLCPRCGKPLKEGATHLADFSTTAVGCLIIKRPPMKGTGATNA